MITATTFGTTRYEVARPALPFLLGWPDTENTPPVGLCRQVTE